MGSGTRQDPPNTEVEARHNPDTVRKNLPVVEKLPDPACGKDCRPSAKDLFSKVNDKLSGLLPEDPDWSSYPKVVILPSFLDALCAVFEGRAMRDSSFQPAGGSRVPPAEQALRAEPGVLSRKVSDG